ncbi:MAG: ABC transporter permease subunit [Acidimicrobiaceae bacterium]|nr:ABC transporter permease subunit [Acidimicrobiaceae bacterium]
MTAVWRRLSPTTLAGVGGLLGVIVLWQVLGATAFSGSHAVPTPTQVLSQMGKDGWSFYWPNLQTTLAEAAKGWFWGNVLGIAMAMLFLIAPVFERPLIQLGVASYCLPPVAILPIFAIVFSGETPKVLLAAMSVFFTTLIGTLVGLRSADAAALDVVHAYGGGAAKKLIKVRLPASLPSMFAGLCIAAPAAVLGAIIGEFLGGNRGLGVAMINSMQALDIARTWGLALVATVVAGAAYAVTTLAGRLLTPWAPRGA